MGQSDRRKSFALELVDVREGVRDLVSDERGESRRHRMAPGRGASEDPADVRTIDELHHLEQPVVELKTDLDADDRPVAEL